MSWSSIITDIILFALVTVITFVSKKYLIPWIQTNHLLAAAEIAVSAAEALYGRYHGDEKLQSALEQLKSQGWDINSDNVINAIKAAWQALDIEEVASGYKEEAEELTAE